MSCIDRWLAWKWSVLLWDGGGQWATLIHGQHRHVESYTRRIVRQRFQDINGYKWLSNLQESAEINKGRFHEILTCLDCLMSQGHANLSVFLIWLLMLCMLLWLYIQCNSVNVEIFEYIGRYAFVAISAQVCCTIFTHKTDCKGNMIIYSRSCPSQDVYCCRSMMRFATLIQNLKRLQTWLWYIYNTFVMNKSFLTIQVKREKSFYFSSI